MKGYLAQRLMTHIGTNVGLDIKIESVTHGCIGVMPVFKTKTAARKWYGRGVKLREVEVPALSKISGDQ